MAIDDDDKKQQKSIPVQNKNRKGQGSEGSHFLICYDRSAIMSN